MICLLTIFLWKKYRDLFYYWRWGFARLPYWPWETAIYCIYWHSKSLARWWGFSKEVLEHHNAVFCHWCFGKNFMGPHLPQQFCKREEGSCPPVSSRTWRGSFRWTWYLWGHIWALHYRSLNIWVFTPQPTPQYSVVHCVDQDRC